MRDKLRVKCGRFLNVVIQRGKLIHRHTNVKRDLNKSERKCAMQQLLYGIFFLSSHKMK